MKKDNAKIVKKAVDKFIETRTDGSLVNLTAEYMHNVFPKLTAEFRAFIIEELTNINAKIKGDTK